MQLSVHRWGLITPEECTALNELYQYNPLLFDMLPARGWFQLKLKMERECIFLSQPLNDTHFFLHAAMQMTVDTR